MVAFTPAQPEEMEAAHAAAAARLPKAKPAPRPRNVHAVLTLGDTEYIQFRGRPYGVPPVPLPLSHRLVEHQSRALELSLTLARRPKPEIAKRLRAEYYHHLRALPALLWGHARPVGRMRIWLRRLGLMRNPFLEATEQELIEIADFFSSRRMKSGVRFPSTATPQTHRPPITSTT